MAFQHKINSGSIFRNKYKEQENHPDHTGSCAINCPKCGQTSDLDIAAWINEFRGGKYFGLRFSEPKRKEMSEENLPRADFDEDVPF